MEVQNEIGLSACPTQAREHYVSLNSERGEPYVSAWHNSTLQTALLCFADADIYCDTLRDTDPFVTVTTKLLKKLHTRFRTSSEPRAQNRWPALPPVMPWWSAHDVPLESSTQGPPALSLTARLQLSVIAQVYNFKLFNPLKPTGHYMYRQFNIHQFYVLPTHCIYVICVDLRTNSHYFPIQH